MKETIKRIFGGAFLVVISSVVASAGCIGVCGTDSANGDVTNPAGFSSYSYITTAGSTVLGGGNIPTASAVTGSEFNGSTLTTAQFSANVGDQLQFQFNFITSDGSGYSDYAWAALEDTSGNVLGYLYTGQTVPTGNTVPAGGLGVSLFPSETLTPSGTAISAGSGTQCDAGGGGCNSPAGGPVWNELGSYSGDCYAVGCGLTGWVTADYTLTTAGNYQLAFGVANQYDERYDTGLALAGVQIAGQTIDTGVAPEPASFALIGLGLTAIGFAVRRRKLV